MPANATGNSGNAANVWRDTEVTQRLNIPYPIIQGPFGGGGSTPLLVSAVSNAGGLGSYGALTVPPEEILKVGADIRLLTAKPFALNLWVSNYDPGSESVDADTAERVLDLLAPYFEELGMARPVAPTPVTQDFEKQAAAVIEAQPAVFSFVFGIPSADILQRCRKRGILTSGVATTVDEALALEEAGVDMIVASGSEAGGAKPSFLRSAEESLTGTIALVPQIVDKVKLPVIAAGGIADGRGVAAALSLGADGAQIGTAFLGCIESGVTAIERECLFQEDARYTGLSRVFTGRLARSIRNRYFSEMKSHEAELPGYPAQPWLTGTLRQAALSQGRTDLVRLWAGQAAALLRHRKAEDLMAALVQDVDAIYAARR